MGGSTFSPTVTYWRKLLDENGFITLPDGSTAPVVVEPDGTAFVIGPDGNLTLIGERASFIVEDEDAGDIQYDNENGELLVP